MNEQFQLMDIQPLDTVSIWPLALGWWLLFIGLLLLLALFVHHQKRPRHWRVELAYQLRLLDQRKMQQSPKQTASDLSILLRRLALAVSSREEVAGVIGDAWLHWLEDTDPCGFAWCKEGSLLLRSPYAPADLKINEDQLDKLIHAARQLARQVK